LGNSVPLPIITQFGRAVSDQPSGPRKDAQEKDDIDKRRSLPQLRTCRNLTQDGLNLMILTI
jgi:hypothetical protein